MKWNKYTVTTPGGFEFVFIMGEWLKPGKYTFGYVELIDGISDDKLKEYLDAEQGIYDIWYKLFQNL